MVAEVCFGWVGPVAAREASRFALGAGQAVRDRTRDIPSRLHLDHERELPGRYVAVMPIRR
jgi:hypothetical protein